MSSFGVSEGKQSVGDGGVAKVIEDVLRGGDHVS